MAASSRTQAKKSNRRSDKIVTMGASDVVYPVNGVGSESYADYQENMRRVIRMTWPHPLTTQGLCAAAGIGERSAQRIMARQSDIDGGAQWQLECHPEHGHRFLMVRLDSNPTEYMRDTRRAHRLANIERRERQIAAERAAAEAE
jgi:hypothetical protein